MRLSLMKAAHVAPFGTAYRKYGYLPGFGRCGNPRTSTLDCARSEEQWTSGSVDSREADDRQLWNPTSAKTGQIWAPIIRYQQGSNHWQPSVSWRSVRNSS